MKSKESLLGKSQRNVQGVRLKCVNQLNLSILLG